MEFVVALTFYVCASLAFFAAAFYEGAERRDWLIIGCLFGIFASLFRIAQAAKQLYDLERVKRYGEDDA